MTFISHSTLDMSNALAHPVVAPAAPRAATLAAWLVEQLTPIERVALLSRAQQSIAACVGDCDASTLEATLELLEDELLSDDLQDIDSIRDQLAVARARVEQLNAQQTLADTLHALDELEGALAPFAAAAGAYVDLSDRFPIVARFTPRGDLVRIVIADIKRAGAALHVVARLRDAIKGA